MRRLLTISFILMAAVNGRTQSSKGFIPIKDGKLYYEKSGTGQPLVFLHGLCLDHRMWEPQIEYFSKFYTCINIDFRGFGISSVPDSIPYSFHEDTKTLLDSLHIAGPVVFIALSMGGKAATNFCLAYPEHVRSLILADVAIDGYHFEDSDLERIARVARDKGIDTANQFFLDEPIFASAKRDSLAFKRIRQMILSYSGWLWTHKNPIHGLSPPAIGQLSQIKVPVLIITGEKDIRDFQQIADILHKNIKQSLKKEIPDAGHMSNMEKPNVFNHLVDDFLRSNN